MPSLGDLWALTKGDIEWAIRLANTKPASWTYVEEQDSEIEVDLLFSGDREELGRFWVEQGISDPHAYSMEGDYRLALFGISCPGGFQTWNPSLGSVDRYQWLPGFLRIKVDVYGDLAPTPAASRLYVPDERSTGVRAAVARACLLNARRLWNSHKSDVEWAYWYESFLTAWNSFRWRHAPNWNRIGLTALREDPEILNLVTEFRDARAKRPNNEFYKLLGDFHSPFGACVLDDYLAGFFEPLDIAKPIPSDRLSTAAAQVGLNDRELESAVDSLSEFLGWDLRKGHPPFSDDP